MIGPGGAELARQVARGSHKERARPAGDVRDFEREDLVGPDAVPLGLVGGLVRPGVVHEGLKGMPHDVLREEARRVVRAGVLAARGCAHVERALAVHDGLSTQIAPDYGHKGQEPCLELRIAHGLQNQALVLKGDAHLEVLLVRLGRRHGGLGEKVLVFEEIHDTFRKLYGVGAGLLGKHLEVLERDFGLVLRLALEAHDATRRLFAGEAEQALVNVADLLDVHFLKRQPAQDRVALDGNLLDAAQHVEHHTVTHGHEECALVVGLRQERVTRGVEDRTAVSRQAHVLKRGAREKGVGGRKQAVPGKGGTVHRLGPLVLFPRLELVEHAGKAVAHREEGSRGQQVALLSKQQEHDAHHDAYGGFINLGGVYGRARPGIDHAGGARLVKGSHQQLDGTADLPAEGLGHLLRFAHGIDEHFRQLGAVQAAIKQAHVEQAHESIPDALLLGPGEGVCHAPCARPVLGCAHERPPPAVGHDAHRAGRAAPAQDARHTVDGAGRPSVGGVVFVKGLHLGVHYEHIREDAAALHKGARRGAASSPVRREDLCHSARRTGRLGRLITGTPPSQLGQDHLDPLVAGKSNRAETLLDAVGTACENIGMPCVPCRNERLEGIAHDAQLVLICQCRHTCGPDGLEDWH